MLQINDKLLDTLAAIDKYDDTENKEAMRIVNIVANLVYESVVNKQTAANYNREFNYNKLKISIRY